MNLRWGKVKKIRRRWEVEKIRWREEIKGRCREEVKRRCRE